MEDLSNSLNNFHIAPTSSNLKVIFTSLPKEQKLDDRDEITNHIESHKESTYDVVESHREGFDLEKQIQSHDDQKDLNIIEDFREQDEEEKEDEEEELLYDHQDNANIIEMEFEKKVVPQFKKPISSDTAENSFNIKTSTKKVKKNDVKDVKQPDILRFFKKKNSFCLIYFNNICVYINYDLFIFIKFLVLKIIIP